MSNQIADGNGSYFDYWQSKTNNDYVTVMSGATLAAGASAVFNVPIPTACQNRGCTYQFKYSGTGTGLATGFSYMLGGGLYYSTGTATLSDYAVSFTSSSGTAPVQSIVINDGFGFPTPLGTVPALSIVAGTPNLVVTCISHASVAMTHTIQVTLFPSLP